MTPPGVRGGEVPHGFDVSSIQLVEFIEFATDNSIDHNSRIIGSGGKAAASSGLYPAPVKGLDRVPRAPVGEYLELGSDDQG